MARALSALCLALALLANCRKAEPSSSNPVLPGGGPGPHSLDAGRTRREAAPRALPRVEDDSFRVPAAERIIAIGDLHGDVRAARAALQLGGAIDSAGNWVGGKLVVVQTGDQLDRGDDEPQILDLFQRLRAEAKAAGGALHALNGNHEIMNVQADFRYVTPDGFHDFESGHPDAQHARLAESLLPEQRGRAAAFLPGGEMARRLALQPVVLQVGDNVFVHGGVLEEHVHYGLGRINEEVRRWMLGPPSERAPASVTQDRALIWVRDYSDGTPSASQCEAAQRVLAALSARRMVMGHTVQKQGINSVCGDKLWRIDVGLSRFYGAQPSVLEIRGDELRVLSGERQGPTNAPRP